VAVAEALLRLSGVGKRFGGVVALDGVDLEVGPGEIASVIGPNGAGKTTLFNVMTGAMTASKGAIEFAGSCIAGLKPHRIVRLGLARTFQNIRLFRSLTVREHFRLAQHAAARRGESRDAGAARLEELLDVLDLRTVEDRPATELSYGQQRRVEIGRALATAPRLLLLDEPVAGMSREETAAIAALLRTLRGRGLTILLIEHDMSFVMELCDRITVLDFGNVIACGEPACIQREPRVLEAYLGREADDAQS
jgi:ABC-type branched-subunit amino acid transport system ATPase component